jgi:ornithine cyclodeaminase
LGADALRADLPPTRAVDLLEQQVRSVERPHTPPRMSTAVGGGVLLLMPAAASDGAGVKLVTFNPDNAETGLPLIHSVYVLFDIGSLVPVAVMDGTELTRIRTAAVAALATRHLARADATRLVVFGAGVQAEAHVEAMCAVRPISHVTVVGRNQDRAQSLIGRLRERGLDAVTGGPGAVAAADIVCTCTTARVPLFDGRDLPPGAHINAIGAYEADAREVDDTTVRRAKVVVEDRDVALAEAGDLIMAIASGAISAEDVTSDLGDAVAGRVRSSDANITLFKSVGMAWEDLVLARAAYRQGQDLR